MNDLNLARKWRPKTFEQIVGQDISVRMLKNSLYLKKFFPVYLFAGLRGCGKTSTARVFGMAVNCKNLPNFQDNPSENTIPCLQCDSCLAMSNGSHPDFIEIDAASHTGVDNVRQIVDSSSYMPLIGQKKIYLIDEAHMLSKAAFNAFLKILEEPPASVLFILATTETPKIPQTVLSRCFQVIFAPIQNSPLGDHLRNICKNEGVTIDDAAIDLLLAETEGSARDAINLLERVRFSGEKITEDVLLRVLGKISTKELCSIFDTLLDKSPSELLANLQLIGFEQVSAQILWDMIVSLCRTILWVKYGVRNFKSNFSQNIDQIEVLAGKCSINRLHAILQLMWSQEDLFLKTNKKHAFLEMILLQICEQTNISDLKDIISALQKNPVTHSTSTKTMPETKGEIKSYTNFSKDMPAKDNQNIREQQYKEQSNTETTETNDQWKQFLQKLNENGDLLLNSILSQSRFIEFDESKKIVKIQLGNNSKFFKDKIEESKSVWFGPMSAIFNNCTSFEFAEISQNDDSCQVRPAGRKPMIDPNPTTAQHTHHTSPQNLDKNGNFEWINVQDKVKWPKANLLINHFPGKISKNS